MPSQSFLDRFAERVARQPDAPALGWGDRTLSYVELSELAGSMRGMIHGLGPRVCVPARKSPETIALLIACVRAGTQVLLPPVELGSEELVELSARAGCSHLLSARGSVRVNGDVERERRPDEAGLLLTTSGTVPTTVVPSTGGVDRYLSWAAGQFDLGPWASVLGHAPLNGRLSLLDIWAALAAGARVELVDQDRTGDGAYLARLCFRASPTVIQALPMAYRLLADAAGGPIGSVEHVIVTGDALPVTMLERLPAVFPRATLWNVYGCTETNASFLHEISVAEAVRVGTVPIGRPIPGVDAVVLESGELAVTTPFQACGIEGRFRTGDLVRVDGTSGLHFLAGRNDYRVKVRGVRINLQEVEQVILRHTDVLEAMVVAVSDETVGNRLHAVVRRQPFAELTADEVRAHCADRLPRAAVPGTIAVIDHALPRKPNGQLDRGW